MLFLQANCGEICIDFLCLEYHFCYLEGLAQLREYLPEKNKS